MITKKSLRQQIKAMLSAQTVDQRDKKSGRIQDKLFQSPLFESAGTVCFYVSLPMEVNTHPMIEASLSMGKRVLVPLVDLENKELKLKEIRNMRLDLRPGTLGILEPVPDRTRDAQMGQVQCWMVPGLAFDPEGRRLGRGGGFYDRLMSRLAPHVPTIGLAFSFQVLPQIPHEDHDRPVDMVLTEK